MNSISSLLITPTQRSRMVSYDRDFSLWLDLQVELLHAGKYTQLDIKNLIDELESMGKRDKRELASRLETLLMHMHKCIHCPNAIEAGVDKAARTSAGQSARCGWSCRFINYWINITPSWRATIVEQRS